MQKNTVSKEKILESALDLFSQKGYDGVGVDMIAENAGLKGPSIYKHFKSKEELLEVLIKRIDEYYNTNFGVEVKEGELPSSVDELVELSMKKIEFTLQDEVIKKTRKIFAMEQFRSPYIAKLATLHNVEKIQEMYEIIFRGMMEKGIIIQENPKMLAMGFVSPISLLVQVCDREPARKAEILVEIKDYIEYFVQTIKC